MLEQRKEKLIDNYIIKHEDMTINDLEQKLNSLDNSFAKVNRSKYGSKLVGNIGLTDSLLPGYGANSGSRNTSLKGSFIDSRFERIGLDDSYASNPLL